MQRSCVVLLGVGAMVVGMAAAEAQVVHRVYYPAPAAVVAPVTTAYVQPATVVYRPLLRPRTRVVAPAATVYAAPTVVARPAVPVTVVPPGPVVTHRHRPILGGTVTRTWYP